jgi:serine/threonine protein kinase
MESAKRIDNYEILKDLGKGSTCKVKLGRSLDTGSIFALKIYTKNKAYLQKIESHALTKIKSHQNIIHLHDFVPEGNFFRPGKEPKTVSYLVLEFCKKGEIFDYLSELGPFPETIARKLFIELISAIEELHSSGLVHRDIKPENIFFSDNYELKLADFGFCAPSEGRDGSGLLYSFKGTRPYMAPEILERKAYNGEVTDLFSSGIILFILAYGRPPFAKADRTNNYYSKIVSKDWNTFWRYHNKSPSPSISSDLKDLIEKMLAYDLEDRISLSDIKTHSWTTKEKASPEECQDFLSKLQTEEISASFSEESKVSGFRGGFENDLILSRDCSKSLQTREDFQSSKCKIICKGDLERIFNLALEFSRSKGEVKQREVDFSFKLTGEVEVFAEIFRAGDSDVFEFTRIQGNRWDFYSFFEAMVKFVKENL